jgi:hypothetical protein
MWMVPVLRLSYQCANHLITEHLLSYRFLSTASFILADANISVDTAEWLLGFSQQTGIPHP